MEHYQNLELTELETSFLKAFIPNLYAEPGFSDINPKEMAQATGMDIKTVKGVMGSLVKKDIIWTMSSEELGIPRENGPIIYLNESYYFLHPDWKNTGQGYWDEENRNYVVTKSYLQMAKENGLIK